MSDFYDEFKKIEKQSQQGWSVIEIAVPNDFVKIWQDTLRAYQIMGETSKPFPAFEAMVMEARNSLPHDIQLAIQ